jgi:hypothetical protein
MGGKSYTVESAKGVLPVHPHCKCCWRPAKGAKTSKKAKVTYEAQ